MSGEFKKVRNLLMSILREPSYDDASCLVFVVGLISIFLWHVEPLLWRRRIFRVPVTYESEWPLKPHPLSGLWLFPFEGLSPALRDNLWIPVAIAYLANAVLLDRFVARHGGGDVSFRISILRLRRLLSGIPTLGLCVIPLWRVLCNRKPGWAYKRVVPRLVLADDSHEVRLLRGGAYLHSARFIRCILVSNLLALKAAVAWMNEPERATATGLLVVQGVCGGLRLGGLACTLAYIRLRSREGDLWGRRKWVLLVCSIAWLLPQILFLLGIAALVLVGERGGAVMIKDVRTHSALERDADRDLGSKFLSTDWSFQPVAWDRAKLKVLRLYREKVFLLMMEVAAVVTLVLDLRERFPWMNLPGCLMAFCYLAALISLPVAGILYARYLFQSFSRSVTRLKVEPPFVRYMLLTSLAVIGGFNIGVLVGRRNLEMLGELLFLVGALGCTTGFCVFLWRVLKADEESLILWPMLFLSIVKVGLDMERGSFHVNVLGLSRDVENVAQFYLFEFYLMIPLTLILTILVGLYRCRWLLRPFRVKDIFNPMLPVRLRQQLAFLVVTACLPLGGVLVPAWIRLRAGLAKYPIDEALTVR